MFRKFIKPSFWPIDLVRNQFTKARREREKSDLNDICNRYSELHEEETVMFTDHECGDFEVGELRMVGNDK